jgi:hypothetical protein
MLILLANVVRSAADVIRIVVHISAMSGAAALELHPLVFALISACSGVLLAGATVFSRQVARGRVRPGSQRMLNAMPTTPDDCGHSVYFTIRPVDAGSTSGSGASHGERVALAAEAARRAKEAAEADLLAASYSQFSLVEMTFETEVAAVRSDVATPERVAPRPAPDACVIQVAPASSAASGASVAFSSVSPPGTPPARTLRGLSSARSASGFGAMTKQESGMSWSPPQNPILIIKGCGYKEPSGAASPRTPAQVNVVDEEMTDTSSSSVTEQSTGSKCAIVNMVKLKDSLSKALGSQLVEMSLDESHCAGADAVRSWNIFSSWRASAGADEPMRRPHPIDTPVR